MEAVYRPAAPLEQLPARIIDDKDGAPEVVIHPHYYPTEESRGTPALSIFSNHSTTQLGQDDAPEVVVHSYYHPTGGSRHETPALSVRSGHPTSRLHQAVWSHAEHGPVFSIPSQYQPVYPLPLTAPPVGSEFEPEPPPEKRICGVRKHVFVLLLGLAGLILLGVAVGVGVGVGVGNQRNGAQSSSQPPVQLTCPGSTNTQLQSSSGVKFLHLCGIDYSGSGEATDIAHRDSDTFAGCMEACAMTDGCDGFGWGPRSGDQGGREVCWMKRNLKMPHTAASDFYFGILLR